jgi:tetratricopeptide (TPR) repeat protein
MRIYTGVLILLLFHLPAMLAAKEAPIRNFEKHKGKAVYFNEIYQLIADGDRLFYQSPDSALKFWIAGEEKAIDALSKTNSAQREKFIELSNYLGELCFNLGTYYYHKSKIQIALPYYHRAIECFKRTQNINGEGLCLNNIGLIHQYYLSEFDKALQYYKQSNYLLKKGNDKENQSTALHNIASIYNKKGQNNLALNYYNQSLALRRELGNKSKGLLGQTLFNLATIYFKLEQADRSKLYLYECLEIFNSEGGERRMLAHTCASLAYIYYENKNNDSALYYAKRSHQISNELNFPSNIRESSKILYKIYTGMNLWKEASTYMKRYIDAKDSLNNEELRNEFIRQQINYEYKSKQYDDSLNFLIGQQAKDNLIKQQEIKIQQERDFRNTTILLSLLIISTGWGVYRRSILKSRDKQNQIKIESLETEQQLLRAQMNPHYIFNSMSVIQGMLLNNNISLSKKYLQKFSALIRSMLDQSAKKLVSLKDEIESVRLYLDLEKLRFNDRLNFSIEYDELLLLNSIKIPPMLIQPFVENAILHGIRHRENGGEIHLSFRNSSQAVICTITDNGIGRTASAEDKQKVCIRETIYGHRVVVKAHQVEINKEPNPWRYYHH